ncbi:threonine/serine exporter family protein [Fusibacter sp. JL298sf-3]
MTYTVYNRIVNIALDTGRVMLLYGAETYRVEETVARMVRSKNILDVNVFVIPTGIILSSTFDNASHTKLVRVAPIGIDLEYIDAANAFSRAFTTGQISLSEAENKMKTFEKMPKFSNRINYVFGAMAGGFFVPLFGGNIVDFVIAYFASMWTLMCWSYLSKRRLNFFIKNIMGSFLGSLFGFLCVMLAQKIGFSTSLNTVLVGPLMTLVPGVSLTNGIRDLISGELLAGSAKIMEALFIAIALAFGVGVVLQVMVRFI